MKIPFSRWMMTALLASSLLEAQPFDAKTIAAATQVSSVLKRKKTVTQGNKAVVSFEMNAAAQAKVFDGSGRDVTKTRVSTATKGNELVLELVKNEMVTVFQGGASAAISPLLEGRKYFSGSLIVAVDDPKKTGQLAVFTGRPYIEIQSKPLQWQPAANAYVAGLTVGIDPDPNSEIATATFPKTTVTLKATGGATVSRVSVDFTGPGAITDLVLRVAQPEGLVTVTARQGGQTIEDQTEVVVRAGQLAISAAKNPILGYGLEETVITAGLLDELGRPLNATTPQTVHVSVSGHGKINLAQLTIPAGASSGEATLTSEGTGLSTVEAKLGARSVSTTIKFNFPLNLILAALIGATVGGVCRGFRADVRKRVRWGRLVLEACVTGLLFTAIVFVGLIADILPPALARSEVGVFVVAGIAGFVGASVLDIVTKKFFGEEKKAE